MITVVGEQSLLEWLSFFTVSFLVDMMLILISLTQNCDIGLRSIFATTTSLRLSTLYVYS